MQIIAGHYKKRKLDWPDGRGARPTPLVVREALFSMLLDVVPGSRLLELSAGGGAIGFEALSRGAEHVTFVEPDSRSLASLNVNIQQFNCRNQCDVQPSNVRPFLDRQLLRPELRYDVVYFNPLYDEERAMKTLERLYTWEGLNPGACVAVYHDRRTEPPPPPAAWREVADRTYGKHRLTLWQHEPGTAQSESA